MFSFSLDSEVFRHTFALFKALSRVLPRVRRALFLFCLGTVDVESQVVLGPETLNLLLEHPVSGILRQVGLGTPNDQKVICEDVEVSGPGGE